MNVRCIISTLSAAFTLSTTMAIATKAFGDTVFYVAPHGNDNWSGRLPRPNAAGTDGPLASLDGARKATRIQLERKVAQSGPVRVEFAEGDYPLAKPVVFDAFDSGTLNNPVIYSAARAAHPVFNGGRKVGGWKREPNGVWTVKLPAVASGNWYFEQLWVNGRRAVRARTPKKFYSYMVGKAVYGIDPDTGKPGNLASRAFRARPDDVRCLNGLNGQELKDATVVVLHSWEISRLRVARFEPATATVVTTGPAAWNFMEWGPTQRYYIENVKSALSEPGEWYLGRDGIVSYIPLPGEDMRKVDVVAPVTEQFIRLEGAPDAPISNIKFEGLNFAYGQHILEPTGHSDGQAAVTVPAVIMADYVKDVTFDRCDISHIGTYGIWFRKGCERTKVTHSRIYDTGAGAIKIGEAASAASLKGVERTAEITVDNCILQSGGHIFPGCVGLYIGQSGKNVITHNDIGDYRYTGISVGWEWGYGETLAKGNTISFNHIHNLGQGVLSDMGGVYTLGPSDGTVVSNNIVHDVYSYDHYGRGGWGLYNDEGTSHMLLENNLVYNTKTGGYHQHYGRENVVRNNIFAFSMDGQLQRSRVEAWIPFYFENNIVYWNDGALYAGTWTDVNMRLHGNTYWQASGKPISFAGMDFSTWQRAGRDTGSVAADPLFVNADKFDFRLKHGSPAIAAGFKPFNYARAGVYGESEWVRLAKKDNYPPVQFAPDPPPAPPLTIHQDFEGVPVGAPCPDAQNNVENRGDSISVTDETAFSGKHSLKVQDAAGLSNIFDPHLVFIPSHKSGITSFHFALRAETGVNMYHEWRDWRTSPYKVGPSFWIAGGKLLIGGKPIWDVPEGAWVKYTVRCGVGTDSDGTWSLTIKPAGGEAKQFNGLRCDSGKLEALTWAGFSSMANERTVFYLDDLDLTNGK